MAKCLKLHSKKPLWIDVEVALSWVWGGARGHPLGRLGGQLKCHCWKRSSALHWSIWIWSPFSFKHCPLLGFFRRFSWKVTAENNYTLIPITTVCWINMTFRETRLFLFLAKSWIRSSIALACLFAKLKALMHQTDIKELAAKKADCCNASRLLYLSHKAALQRTEESTALDQQACTFSNCVKEIPLCRHNSHSYSCFWYVW